jgi:CheY-like chemotaxis protein
MQQDKKYRILLADDNFDMREYLGRLLSEKYEVVTVCDGTVTHDTHTTRPTTRHDTHTTHMPRHTAHRGFMWQTCV